MEWQVELYTFRLSGETEILEGLIAAKLSKIDALRHVTVRPGLQGLAVMYTGEAKDLEQAVSELVPPGVRALDEALGQAGQPVGTHMLEIIPAEWGRLGLPEPD